VAAAEGGWLAESGDMSRLQSGGGCFGVLNALGRLQEDVLKLLLGELETLQNIYAGHRRCGGVSVDGTSGSVARDEMLALAQRAIDCDSDKVTTEREREREGAKRREKDREREREGARRTVRERDVPDDAVFLDVGLADVAVGIRNWHDYVRIASKAIAMGWALSVGRSGGESVGRRGCRKAMSWLRKVPGLR
jgi:hypothetical protein